MPQFWEGSHIFVTFSLFFPHSPRWHIVHICAFPPFSHLFTLNQLFPNLAGNAPPPFAVSPQYASTIPICYLGSVWRGWQWLTICTIGSQNSSRIVHSASHLVALLSRGRGTEAFVPCSAKLLLVPILRTSIWRQPLLGDPEVTPNIYCKSRNLPNTDTQNYSTDLR